MSKDLVRREVRARIRALTVAQRDRAGAEIARRIWTLPEVAGAHALLLFASLPLEVPTDAIATEARRRGIEVVYPRCLPETRELALHRVSTPEELQAGEFGIREPDAEICPLVGTAEIDVAFIPGLAWDRRGGRLGRGAGYYDRLLAAPEWRALRCGLFFAAQEVDTVPMDPWDVPLEVVVTERAIVRGARSEARGA